MHRIIVILLVLISASVLIMRSQSSGHALQGASAMDGIAYVDGAEYATIQAADKALGLMPGEIWVSRKPGTTITGPLNISALHTVKFIQGGVYTISGTITLNQGACLVGEPGGEGDGVRQPSVILKMANGANLSPMIRYAGSQACILYMVLDGNKANNSMSGPILLANAGVRTNTSYSTIENSKADGADVISTGAANQAAAAEFDRVMFINNDLDGLYCADTGDVWATNKTQFENSGLGGGAFAGSSTTVNTSDRTVNWMSGTKWTTDRSIVGRDVSINDIRYSVASVRSTTELTLRSSAGTQRGANLRMGHGVELSGCNGVRIEDSDLGGNQLDGIKIYGTKNVTSAGVIITGNQFGENLEYDAEIQGWDPVGNRFGAFGEHIVDNYFIGGSARKSPWIWSAIYVQDSQDNEIASNSFLPFAAHSYTYGVQIHETIPGREGRDNVVGNSFSGVFVQGSFGSNAASPTGFEGNKEAVLPNSLFSQPYIGNNDSFDSVGEDGTLDPLFVFRNNIHFIYGHPTKREIDLQPKPNTTRLQVLDGAVNVLDVPLSAPSVTVGSNGTRLTRYARYSATESPSPVGASTCAGQAFSNVKGIIPGDTVIAVSKPEEQPGLTVAPGHVEGKDTLTVDFCNVTSRPIIPNPRETYQFVIVQ